MLNELPNQKEAFVIAGGSSDKSSDTDAEPLAMPTGTGMYSESPMLASRVASGELPAVDDRLPAEPLVLTQKRNVAPDGFLKDLKIGKLGGTLRMINLAPGIGPEMYFMTLVPILARPGASSPGNAKHSYRRKTKAAERKLPGPNHTLDDAGL